MCRRGEEQLEREGRGEGQLERREGGRDNWRGREAEGMRDHESAN